LARAPWQADDIDGIVHLACAADAPALVPGALVDGRVEQVVDDYDFHATLLRVVDLPGAAPTRSGRSLPLIASDSTSVGSYGR
jgi:ribosomal protein S12 methylthiotransferase